MAVHFIGYSNTNAAYRALLENAVVTSIHVLFDESIPERSADFFRNLNEATVKCDPEKRLFRNFDWQVGQSHMNVGSCTRAQECL